MKKDPRIYLAHILECAEKIERYIKGGEKAFFTDTIIQDAVIRNFEVIGEAVKRIPADLRQQYPDVPWDLMAGFRDVLIHNYEGVDLKRVWKIAKHDLPPVKKVVSAILPPLARLEQELAGEENAGGKGGELI
ncbi:MAG: HepT-like ribonuclease domain-containing protein [Candidatus Loosdrechtia sp.]|uniref:HepT-like ribonuclease domain-containing protein n=1 Tax=Candidatus Loosdrechtia sp. TaxID=3101272 RepID=UPI003A6917ED|nr:MAG: DUF86 domain-containing protein [Candidatus Jettenia sp. AMX2]